MDYTIRCGKGVDVAVSIETVAKHVGVSGATVSRVLNGKPGFQASEETRRRIQDAAVRLGYAPNRMARSMKTGRSETIGVIVAGLSNPFFAGLVETAQKLASEVGFHALVEVTPGQGNETRHVGHLAGWPVEGMIVWSNPWTSLVDESGNRSISGPIVYLGYPRSDGSDWVAFDLYDGGRQIAEHVYDRGRRNAWYVTPFASHVAESVEDRIRAFVDVSRERGFEGKVVATPREEESREIGIEFARSITELPKSERPDALICHNDLLAIGVSCGLVRGGIRVPEDIVVTGFDGSPEGQYLDRPLTTIFTSSTEMARSALEIVFARIGGDKSEPIGKLIRGTLMTGATT